MINPVCWVIRKWQCAKREHTPVHLDTLSDRSVWVTQHHSNHLILLQCGLQSNWDQRHCTAVSCLLFIHMESIVSITKLVTKIFMQWAAVNFPSYLVLQVVKWSGNTSLRRVDSRNSVSGPAILWLRLAYCLLQLKHSGCCGLPSVLCRSWLPTVGHSGAVMTAQLHLAPIRVTAIQPTSTYDGASGPTVAWLRECNFVTFTHVAWNKGIISLHIKHILYRVNGRCSVTRNMWFLWYNPI